MILDTLLTQLIENLAVITLTVFFALLVPKAVKRNPSLYTKYHNLKESILNPFEQGLKLSENQRIEANKVMAGKEFRAWELAVLRKIYPNLKLLEKNGITYPVVLNRSLSNIEQSLFLNDDGLTVINRDKLQSKYWRFLEGTIKRPKMRGFATKAINLDEQGSLVSISCKHCTYEQNVITSHILEYELYEIYRKAKADERKIVNLEDLNYRKRYHGKNNPEQAVYHPSECVFPLLSVQALVCFRKYDEIDEADWKIFVAERSSNTATKAGLWQFQPARGFEVYGSGDDIDEITVKENFRPVDALMREYAEELFNAQELSFMKRGSDSPLLNNKDIKKLRSQLRDSKATLDFLGIVTDLTTIRHELSFLILIDDPDWHPADVASSETKHILKRNYSEILNRLAQQPFHGSSVRLLSLAEENDKFIKYVKENQSLHEYFNSHV